MHIKLLTIFVENVINVINVIGSIFGSGSYSNNEEYSYEAPVKKTRWRKPDPEGEKRAKIRKILSANEGIINEKTLAFGKEFLETAAWGDDRKIQVFVEEGFPVTYQDPKTGSTALHRAAACMARDVIRVLIKADDCDFLIRDNKGRLSSEMAYLYGRDPALARLLGIKERKQADAQGIKLTRRPPPEPKP